MSFDKNNSHVKGEFQGHNYSLASTAFHTSQDRIYNEVRFDYSLIELWKKLTLSLLYNIIIDTPGSKRESNGS
jgi:hypothetical protein